MTCMLMSAAACLQVARNTNEEEKRVTIKISVLYTNVAEVNVYKCCRSKYM